MNTRFFRTEDKKRFGVLCVTAFLLIGVLYFAQKYDRLGRNITLIYDPALPSEGDIQLRGDFATDGHRNIRNPYNIELTTRDDKVYVYKNEIPDADPGSIEAVSREFLADKNNVYFVESAEAKKIDNLRPENLRVVNNAYPSIVVNDTQVYFIGYNNSGQFVPIVSRPKTLNSMSIEDEGYLLLTDTHNLYLATDHHFFEFPTASPRLLGDNSLYIVGKEDVFYEARRINGADPTTFELIKHAGADKKVWGSYAKVFYARDARNVYFKGDVIIGADPKSFMVYDVAFYQEYARDAHHVYVNGKIIPGADPLTFTVLKKQVYEGCGYGSYGKDANAVFYFTNKVENADPATFELLHSNYGKDAQRSFWRDRELPISPEELHIRCIYG